MQAEPDERPHATRMGWAAKERHGVIDLDVLRNAQALPDFPEAIEDILPGFGI